MFAIGMLYYANYHKILLLYFKVIISFTKFTVY